MLTMIEKDQLLEKLKEVVITEITNKAINADAQTIRQVTEDYSLILGRITAIIHLEDINKESLFKINAIANDLKNYIVTEYMKVWGAGGILPKAKNILN